MTADRSAYTKINITGWLVSGILVLIYILAQWFHYSIDATEERRYTLTPATKQLLEEIDQPLYVRVLLEGKFPAGFKRLQESTGDMLRQFARINTNIEYEFDDPNQGTHEQVNARRQQLAEDGLIPTQLRLSGAAAASAQYIYPFAIIHSGDKRVPVSLLQDDIPGADKDLILNNSIALLEYKLASGIKKVNQYARKEIAFTMGQGELSALQTSSIEKDLRTTYAVTRINLDSIVQIPDYLKLLIIAKPTERFSEAHLFMLDQYIMRGGNVILLVDPLIVSLDSISVNKIYIPPMNELGLDPLLFRLGARLQPDLVLDLQCTRIPMVVGMQGERVQTELFPWYYHPLISSTADHPITHNLDRIQLEFPSSIDTIQTGTSVKKTILLRSSDNARIQLTPVRLNFNILQEEPDPALFNKQGLGFAVMLEGSFESMFKNRLSEAQMNVLADAGLTFTAEAVQAKVLVVTDGDIIKNLVNSATGETAPLGYNKYEQTIFSGNRDFILNAVEYMLDDSGVLQARSKDIKLRLMNVVKAREEGMKWQLINIVGPLLLIVLMGWLYQWRRKRKFGIPV